jgi:hypothetical protein
VGVLENLLSRRRARHWQRWSEVEPEEDYFRRARLGTAIAGALFVLLIAVIVIGLVFAR